MQQLTVNTTPPTQVAILSDAEQAAAALAKQITSETAVLICDQQVIDTIATPLLAKLQAKHPSCHLLSFPGGETHKTRTSKQVLEDQLFERNCPRSTTLIALGGGITLDLVGFVAATYQRGIACIYYPTSLLAMVDACIGGKTGLNTERGKNLIGVIKQPDAVIIDTTALTTLPIEHWHNGFAEMVKQAAVADATLFADLESVAQNWQQLTPTDWQPWIARCLKIKADIVVADPEDKGWRQSLNFGHTIGHALEACTDYQLSHGQAVAYGMLAECWLAEREHISTQQSQQRLQACLQQFGLCQAVLPNINTYDFIACLKRDKKNQQQHIHMALIQSIGRRYQPDNNCFTAPFSEAACLDVLSWLNDTFTHS